MAGTFNDFWRTWKATLPMIPVGSETAVAGLTIAEGSLSRKGMLHAVTSQANRGSDFNLVNIFKERTGSNSRTIAKYKYRQRRVLADIGAVLPVSYCTAGTTPTWLDGEQIIGAPIVYKTTIEDNDLMDVAKYGDFSFQDFISDELKLAFEAITSAMEARVITEFNTLRGINLTNGLLTAVPAEAFQTLANLNVNPKAADVMRNEFRRQEYTGDFIAVGDERFNSYVNAAGQTGNVLQGSLQSSAQNDFLNADGQAVSRSLRGMQAYDSAHLDSTLANGLQNVFAWKPGAFQLLEAFDFLKPGLQMDTDTYKKGTILVNYGGLPFMFDYVMNYEMCTSGSLGWTITWAKKIGTFAFPNTDQYQATDPLFTSNGLATFSLTAGA